MNAGTKSNRWMHNGLAGLLAGLFIVAGCGGNDKKVKNSGKSDDTRTSVQAEPAKPTQVAANEPEPVKAAPANTEPEAVQPVQPVAAGEPQKTDGPVLASADVPSANSTRDMTDDERKRIIEDGIYVRIRITMEKMLEERRELLAGGVSANDERVHGLERSILRARDLLVSSGEQVEDFDPPISAPPPPPPGQPTGGSDNPVP